MHRAIQGKGLLQGAGICCRCLGTFSKLQMWKLYTTFYNFDTFSWKRLTTRSLHWHILGSILRYSLCSCKCAGLAFGFRRAFTSCSINASRCVDAEQITTSRDTERPWSSLGLGPNLLLQFLHDKSSLNCCNELFMSCLLDTSKTHQLFFPEHQIHEQSYTVIFHKSSLSLGLDGWILQNGSCQQLAIHFPIGSCHMLHDALTIGHDWTMDLQIRLLQQKWMQGRNLLVNSAPRYVAWCESSSKLGVRWLLGGVF